MAAPPLAVGATMGLLLDGSAEWRSYWQSPAAKDASCRADGTGDHPADCAPGAKWQTGGAAAAQQANRQ
jgi:hypothetical protein